MKRARAVLLLALLCGLAVAGQVLLCRLRRVESPILSQGAFAALGGLRSIAAEVVWFRADRLQEEGRYVELAQLARALTHMEPHTPEVWSYAAWNLAYNVSVMMTTGEDRWRWVHSAIRLLRDEGLALNPGEGEIYRELAWLFELKLGVNLDSAAAVYRREWRRIVEDVKARGAWEELRMDPEHMRFVERSTGLDDWTDPQLSAVYWASLGLACARGKDVAVLREIVRQATVLSTKNRANLVK